MCWCVNKEEEREREGAVRANDDCWEVDGGGVERVFERCTRYTGLRIIPCTRFGEYMGP